MKDNSVPSVKAQRPAEGEGPGQQPGFWMSGANDVLEQWRQYGTGWMTGAADLAQEMLTFSQKRIQADIDAWRSLAPCRSPGDFADWQRQFTDRSATEYLEEAARLNARLMETIARPFAEARTGKQ